MWCRDRFRARSHCYTQTDGGERCDNLSFLMALGGRRGRANCKRASQLHELVKLGFTQDKEWFSEIEYLVEMKLIMFFII